MAFDLSRILMRIASFSRTGSDGVDFDDADVIAVSIDGGDTYSEELVIMGSDNSRLAVSNGIGRLDYDGDHLPLTIVASTGLSTGVSKIRIIDIPGTLGLMFKVTLTNNHINEIWIINDIEVYGY